MNRPPMHTSTWVIMTLLMLLALPFDIFVYDFAFERRLPPLMAGLMAILLCSQLAIAYGFSRVVEWLLRRNGRIDWLQLHLSTCVVLMFVASGIVGLNLMTSGAKKQIYGWPLGMLIVSGDTTDWLYSHLTLNIGIIIVILFCVGALCEFRLRKPGKKIEPEGSTP